MYQSNERDNYTRISGLLHDNATPICGKLMEQHLKRINKSFPDFIDDHQHDIFHFYSDKMCCLCKDNPSGKSILRKTQIMILFDTDDKSQRRRGHKHQRNKNVCCCFAKKNIKVDNLDFTLLKFMLIHFCEDEFWFCFLVSCQDSFEDFLDKQRHNLFHLWQPNCACCLCRTGYVRPNANFIDNHQFRKVFIKTQAVCSTPSHKFHSCIFKAKPGLTYKELKQRDLRLFYSLTNFFCPLRKCIETLGDRRNDVVAHTVSAKISCDDFDVLWRGMVTCILEIAVAVDYKTEAERRIDYQKTGPLDMNMSAQWQTELLAEINQKEELAYEIKDTKDMVQFGLEVIDAKIDKSIENDTCLRNLIKESCNSIMHSIDQEKKQRELEKDQILNHSEQVNTTVLNGPLINAIVNENNRVKVKIAQVELKITCVKTQIREVHDFSFNQTETFNVIEHFEVERFYKELKGFLLYISVLSWYTKFLLEYEIMHGSELGASLKTPESPDMNDVDVNEALGNYSYDDDDEDIKDTYECGRCEAKFQSLDRFMNHKMSCKVKKNGKKVTKSDVDCEDLTSQFRCTLSTDDEHVMNDIQKMIKENTHKFTTTNMGNDFYEKGSLVIWGKMNTSVTKNRESVKKCMEVFVVNMLENCQINSEKETKVTVKLDILKEIEGCEDDDEDVFCCGRCNKLFNRIDTFSSHKKDCNRRARLLRTIRQKTLLLGEIPRTVEAQCNLSEQTTGLQTDTNVVVEMFGDTESKPEVTETAVETDTNVLVEKLGDIESKPEVTETDIETISGVKETAVRMESEVVATQSNVFESKGMEEQSRGVVTESADLAGQSGDTAPVAIQMIDKPKDIVVLGTQREVKDFIFKLQKNTEKFDYMAGLYANDKNTQLDTLLVTYQFIFILYTENFDMKKAGLTEEDVDKIRRIDNYPQIKIVCNCERRLVNEAISRIDLDFKNERWDDFLKEDSKYLDILKQLRMLHLKKTEKKPNRNRRSKTIEIII